MWLHRRAAHLLLLISVLGTPLLARGAVCEQPRLVQDSTNASMRDPDHLVAVGKTLFFTVDGGPSTGVMLWKSDGTPGGTVSVQPKPSSWETTASLDHFTSVHTAVGDQLFFFVATSVPSIELWTSNGTSGGTGLVPGASFPDDFLTAESRFVAAENRLFFSANDGVHGFELWSSDATSFARVLDATKSGIPSPSSFTIMNGKLFFLANDGTGDALWMVTGPTSAARVMGLNPLAASLTVMGNMLYFTALDGTNGVTLWKTNGVAAPERVAPNKLLPYDAYPSDLTAAEDKLFFTFANSTWGAELWVTDGTEAGTHLVKDIQVGNNPSDPQKLTALGTMVFFLANDGSTGQEPWRSDGTPQGTQRVKDFIPGPPNPNEPEFLAGAGMMLARINDDSSGSELWRFDAAGATQLADIASGPASSTPHQLTIVDNQLYFIAKAPTDNELYMLPFGQVDCSKPVITCPKSQVLEAASSSGTFYESPPFQVTDDAVVPPTFSVEPQTVSDRDRLRGVFGLGSTSITLTATDPAGNPSESCPFTVTVRDTTPPTLLCPDGKVEQEVTGPETSPFFFVLAYDAAVPRLIPDYHGHPPGSVFPLGDTPVHVTVSDGNTREVECNFTVSVVDTVPPRITCPETQVREAKSAEDLFVDYDYQVVDLDSPVVTPKPDLPSGSKFPVGTTEVTLEARDAAGLTDSCKFVVSISDPEPPTISCPEPLQVTASQPEGAEVDFLVVANDNLGADSVDLKYSQAPKTFFPVGETPVTATVTDLGKNSVSCTFTVTVSEYVVSDGSCQAAGSGGALGWLLVVLLPVWARRRDARVAR